MLIVSLSFIQHSTFIIEHSTFRFYLRGPSINATISRTAAIQSHQRRARDDRVSDVQLLDVVDPRDPVDVAVVQPMSRQHDQSQLSRGRGGGDDLLQLALPLPDVHSRAYASVYLPVLISIRGARILLHCRICSRSGSTKIETSIPRRAVRARSSRCSPSAARRPAALGRHLVLPLGDQRHLMRLDRLRDPHHLRRRRHLDVEMRGDRAPQDSTSRSWMCRRSPRR